MPYVDGFVLPVPKTRLAEYKAIAKVASKVWKEHGALEYWECVGDDLTTEGTRSFTEMAAAADDETVMFSWAVFESREARDAANEKIAVDPRIAALMHKENPIMGMERMAFGGFEALVRA